LIRKAERNVLPMEMLPNVGEGAKKGDDTPSRDPKKKGVEGNKTNNLGGETDHPKEKNDTIS